MNHPPLANEQYYHIYNRGVDKRQVFMDDEDRYRFLHDLWEFNDENAAPPFIRRTAKNPIKTTGGETPDGTVGGSTSNSKKPLVEICCFCLMPNHFHLLIKQLMDGGISMFMKKLGAGYTGYFNEKYERSGALFQGRFKTKHIDNDAYLTHLTKYIHLNPIDLCEPEWKNDGLQNPEMTKDFLNKYKWSSLKDYVGEKNYPSLINKELILGMLGGESEYKKFVLGVLDNNFKNITDYLLD